MGPGGEEATAAVATNNGTTAINICTQTTKQHTNTTQQHRIDIMGNFPLTSTGPR